MFPARRGFSCPYVGGVGAYREKCDAVAESGYTGFTLTKEGGSIRAAVINEDVYHRTPDGWRIAHRRILPLITPHVDRFEL